MHHLIATIIDRFGGRAAGSEAERKAQHFIKEEMDRFCDSTVIEEFSAPLTGRKTLLNIFCVLLGISFALYHWHMGWALGLSLLTVALMMGVFANYRTWLDFMMPKQTSLNVIGVIEPQKECKQTVIISGHMDSTYEYIWWYRLGGKGLFMTLYSGFLFMFLPVFYLLVSLFYGFSQDYPLGVDLIWGLLLLVYPFTVLFLVFMYGKDVVPGAQDNLSGIASMMGVGDLISKGSPLMHTRVKLVSFGSEEVGLRGAQAYAQKHQAQLQSETTYMLNVDGVKDFDRFCIFQREIRSGVKQDPTHVKAMQESFKEIGVDCILTNLRIGATDATPLARLGVPALTICAQDTVVPDPTYHTRLDIAKCVDVEAVQLTSEAIRHFIKIKDQQ